MFLAKYKVGTVALSTVNVSYLISEELKTPEQRKEEKEAIDRLVSDLPENEEDYLDMTLDEEREFLTEYLVFVKSLMS